MIFVTAMLLIVTISLAGCPLPVPCGPEADFSANATHGEVPLTMTFTDKSELGSSTGTTWYWLFGDGNSSTQQNPVHTYTAAGNYDVSLTVTEKGRHNTKKKSNFIQVNPPEYDEPLAEYPIANEVYTTREVTIVPVDPTGGDIHPWDIAEYEQYGYGQWTYGEGVDLG